MDVPTAERRQHLLARLRLRREKLRQKLNRAPFVPTKHSDIRAACVYFYERKDPWFRDIRKEVDRFVKEVEWRLHKSGIHDPRAIDLARDLVISGMSVVNEERKGFQTFFHHFARRTPEMYGAPYLFESLETLCFLEKSVEHLTNLDEEDPAFDIILGQAEKLRRDLVKSLSKPIGGFALKTRRSRVAYYQRLICSGWERLTLYKTQKFPPTQQAKEVGKQV